MPGGVPDAYLYIAFFFGLAGGVVGKIKGSSFWLWFLISGVVPVFGLLAAVVFRNEREEERRLCPRCKTLLKLHDTVCMRCGAELYFPRHVIPSENELIRSQLHR